MKAYNIQWDTDGDLDVKAWRYLQENIYVG